MTLGKTAIGVYLGRASVGSAYGAAGLMTLKRPGNTSRKAS